MSKIYLFPGQGSQFAGMGLELEERFPGAAEWMSRINEVAGYDLREIMARGSEEDLRQTKVTQPAVYVYGVVAALAGGAFAPAATAGHSLGEFSALAAAGVFSFEDGLKLVLKRALAMQAACELQPSGMAAVMGYESERQVEEICASIEGEIVVPANYNAPAQLVISGSLKGIELAGAAMKAAGIKRVIPLKVGGAFHSPLMEPARVQLAEAIAATNFCRPVCPVYQNVDGRPSMDPEEIKDKLIRQLTAAVLWTESVQRMHADFPDVEFIETGPGKVLSGLVSKILS
jgi:[acyl-carrier-protein] S-malonyltransferase